YRFLQKFEALGIQPYVTTRNAGNVATRVGKAGSPAKGNGIRSHRNSDNRDGVCCPLRHCGRSRAPSCNYVDLTLDEIGSKLGETIGLPSRVSSFDSDVFPVHPTEFLERVQERTVRYAVAAGVRQIPERGLPWLLRLCCERRSEDYSHHKQPSH